MFGGGGGERVHLAQTREKQRAVVKTVMNFCCRKMQGISGLAEELLASHEELRYMGLLFVIWDCLRLCLALSSNQSAGCRGVASGIMAMSV